MGFADLSIADIAEDYNLAVDDVIALCRQFGIPFDNADSFLSLEDAKRVINWSLEHSSSSRSSSPATDPQPML